MLILLYNLALKTDANYNRNFRLFLRAVCSSSSTTGTAAAMIQTYEPPPQSSLSPSPGIGSLPTNFTKEEDAAEIHPRQEERDSSTTAARPNKKMRRLRPAASALRGQEDVLKLIRSFLRPSAHPYSYKVRMDLDGLVEHVVVEALHDDGVEDNEEEQNDDVDVDDDDTDTDEEFDDKNNEEKESDIVDDPQPTPDVS